jgi:hypothetical protein
MLSPININQCGPSTTTTIATNHYNNHSTSTMPSTCSSGMKTHHKTQTKPATPQLAISGTCKHATSQVNDDCMAKKQCNGVKKGAKGGEEEENGEKKKGKRGSTR